jgi:hypothetical protein
MIANNASSMLPPKKQHMVSGKNRYNTQTMKAVCCKQRSSTMLVENWQILHSSNDSSMLPAKKQTVHIIKLYIFIFFLRSLGPLEAMTFHSWDISYLNALYMGHFEAWTCYIWEVLRFGRW